MEARLHVLGEYGIRATWLYENMSRRDEKLLETSLRSDKIDVLCALPGTARSLPWALSRTSRPLRLLAILEADRISNKLPGHSATYLSTRTLIDSLRPQSVVCFTNRTSKDVHDDICVMYGLPMSSVSYIPRLPKKNLRIDTVVVDKNDDKLPALLGLLQNDQCDGRTAIFVKHETLAIQLAKELQGKGVDAGPIVDVSELGSRKGNFRPPSGAAVASMTNRVLVPVAKSVQVIPHSLNVKHVVHYSVRVADFLSLCLQVVAYLR